MPKYTKQQRYARRRLFRMNIPLTGLKEGKAGYKQDIKTMKKQNRKESSWF